MKRSKHVHRESRRDALKGIAALSGAAVASAAVGTASAAVEAPGEAKQPPGKLGYRETAHVREYYRRARF